MNVSWKHIWGEAREEELGLVGGAARAGLEQCAISHFSYKEKGGFTCLVLISYIDCTR